MKRYILTNAPWYAYEGKMSSIIVKENVLSISLRVFFSHWKLKNVSISDGMYEINAQAFLDCIVK